MPFFVLSKINTVNSGIDVEDLPLESRLTLRNRDVLRIQSVPAGPALLEDQKVESVSVRNLLESKTNLEPRRESRTLVKTLDS